MTVSISRRRFLSVSASVPVAAATLGAWQVQAATPPAAPAAAAGASAAQLTMDDPRAPALGYVTDAAKAAGDPMFKPGSNCANCSQLKGKVGDKLRPCALFPDLKNPKQMLLVTANGWCRSWTAIPKTS
jgi:secreted PhoX family phosphatase